MTSQGRINTNLGKEGEIIRALAEKSGHAITYELCQAIRVYAWIKAVIEAGGGVYTAPSEDAEKTRLLLF